MPPDDLPEGYHPGPVSGAAVGRASVRRGPPTGVLINTSGTGNMTELSRKEGRHRTARFTGDTYASPA